MTSTNWATSRRGFMAGAAAGGLVLGMGMPAMAQDHTPKKGGTLRVGYTQGESSDSMDPATYSNDFMFAISYAVFSTLVEIGPDGTAQPSLAESWEPDADAASWTFRLRDDATFSDGTRLRAVDVISSIRHHMGDASKSGVKSLLSQIADIRADGDSTVVFDLSSGSADFPLILNDYHLTIRKDMDGRIDADSMIGTGGYVIENFEPGVRADLRRRDDYWKEGRAHFDRVVLLKVGDPAARMNALVTGEVDLIDRPDLKTLPLMVRNPNLRVHTQNGTLHYTMPMNTKAAPFDDANVRMAVKYAIDRQAIVDKILLGYGTVGNDHPIASSMPFYNPDLEQHAYDPDKAKHFLSKAGLDGLDITLQTSDAAFNGAVDASVLFAEAARAANINITVDRQPDDGYWSNVWLKSPFCCSYWGGRPTPDLMFSSGYAAGADWNDTHWENPRFNELLVAARSELDQGLRTEMYAEMQGLCQQDNGSLIPAFGQYVSAMSTKIRMPERISEMWDLDSVRFIERWWMA
ncbi:ABC transporter substrate-binding protein [Paracoccus sp. PARArs4]|uniref:ABC transporter substrate-binding protein n=1 Tax=Paracoccus sp. PARArs4 TaxID=2853442 RepID=UPI0024A735B9|nr:ABC transporter substrate-binding protein [Paracoccus sp. PARArs4]